MDALETVGRFQPYLVARERTLWSGQPKQGLALSGRDALLIPFSLMWGGFAIFWNAMVWFAPFGGSPDWFLRLWGLPFLIVGLYMIAGRFFHDARLRKKLFYAVTDQRILVLRDSKVISLDIHRLPRLELSEQRDGTGTLTFELSSNAPFGGMRGFGWWTPALSSSAEFFRIKDPRRVYELVRNQTHHGVDVASK